MEDNHKTNYRLVQYFDSDNQRENKFSGSKGAIVLEGNNTNGFIEKIIESIDKDCHFEIHYNTEGRLWNSFKIGDFNYVHKKREYNEKTANLLDKWVHLSQEGLKLHESFNQIK